MARGRLEMPESITEAERRWWEEAGRLAIQAQDLSRQSSQARLNELARGFSALLNRVTFEVAPERQRLASEYVHGMYAEMVRVFGPEFQGDAKVSEFTRRPFSVTIREVSRAVGEVLGKTVPDALDALLAGLGLSPSKGAITAALGLAAIILLAFVMLKEA